MVYNNYCVLTGPCRHRSPEVPPADDTSSSKTATKIDDGQTNVELETISQTNKFYKGHQEPACIQVPPPDGQTHNRSDATSGAQEEINEEENYYELPRFQ